MHLAWNSSMSVHVKILDAQHKNFIRILNQLMDLLEKQCSEEELEKILVQFNEYKKLHFGTEEDFFKKSGYPGAKEHIAEHKKFIKKMAGFKAKLKKDHIKTGFDIVDFVEDWLLDHIAHMDHKYITWFNEHGIK